MIHVDEFSSPLTKVNIQSLATGVQAPKFAAAIRSHSRRCVAVAVEQGLRDDELERNGACALLGFTKDRSVVGLQRQDGVWRISRIQVPSVLVSHLCLMPLTCDKAQPVWVRLLPGYLAVYKDGKEVSLWDGRGGGAASPAMASRGSSSPTPDI